MEKFVGTDVIYTPKYRLPMTMLEWIEPGANWLDRPGNQNIFTTGRLKDGVSVKQAEMSLDLLAQQLGREYPDTNEGQRIKLTPPGMVIPTLRGAMISFAWVMLLNGCNGAPDSVHESCQPSACSRSRTP